MEEHDIMGESFRVRKTVTLEGERHVREEYDSGYRTGKTE